MKKKLMFILPAVSLLLAGLVVFNLFIRKPKNIAKGYDPDESVSTVIDDAGIFDDDEDTLDKLNELAEDYSEKLEMNIIVYLSGSSLYEERDTEIFCDDYYDTLCGKNTDGILYFMDLSGVSSPLDWISTSGKAVLLYQKNLNTIFKTLDNYLPASGKEIFADDIESAVKEFFRQIEKYEKKKPGFFSKYHDKDEDIYFYYKGGEFIVSEGKPASSSIIILLISAAVGAIVGIIAYFSIKSKYKFKNSANPSVYISQEESRLTEQSDTFIRSYVTKRKIETSSGGGGIGRSGGGRSGGGGHGGGGHRR